MHGFEPSPDSFALLNATILRNNLKAQVRANQIAVYSEPGEMDFQVHTANHGAFDGFQETGYAGAGEAKVIKVPVTTLDIYAKQVALVRLDLLKIDAEGAELFVLRGARDVLVNLQPVVLFEVGYQNLRPYGVLPVDIYRFFEDVGYRVMNLRRRELSEVEFSHASVGEHEFIAMPGSKKPSKL